VRRRSGLILLGVLAIVRSGHCEGPTPEIPSDLVLERFAVANNGDVLLIPVRIANKDHLVVVDTGTTNTLFDTSLPLGQPVGSVMADGAQKTTELTLYNPPAATAGKLPMHLFEPVAGMDMKSFRQISGHPVEGILGMDFLGNHVVQMDIAKGELVFLKSAPKNAGEELPISWEPGDVPYITGQIPPEVPFRFVVDTGMGGLDSGDLGVFKTRSLTRKGKLKEIGKTLMETISGTNSRLTFQGTELKVGTFAVQSPIFSESHGVSPDVLGRGFWSRFAVTFDFPKRKVYLRKSAGYGRPDRWNSTGLHLWKKTNLIEVHSVDPDSPASRAGLMKGDVLIELEGMMADKTSLFALFEVLCKGGQMTCLVRRETQERRMIMNQAR
jgi:hypothetical protein